MSKLRIILSGGGTGGHVFPAISIANAIREKRPDAEILFVGAKGKIEMEKVPAAGYEIVGLNIQGIQRSLSLKNLLFPFRLIQSLYDSYKILKRFNPQLAIGVGGYASGPLLYMARWRKLPYIIQEQNSYAGVTNKILAKNAAKICVAYEGMERYFPKDKIHLTGNPVRSDFSHLEQLKAEAYAYFQLNPNQKTIFVTGGSLGARTLNDSILKNLDFINNSGYQVLWQTGRFYYSTIVENGQNQFPKGVKIFEFISNMDMAYSIADIIISRAGAGTISELCLVKKAVILVPSPNVAEDHQTKNAMALVKKGAAWMVTDAEAREKLIQTAFALLENEQERKQLSTAIATLAKPNAGSEIADEVLKLIK